MRKSVTLLTILLSIGGAMGFSQSRLPQHNGKNPPAGFKHFRDSIKTEFQNFKSRILDHYDEFLDGKWNEFESIMEDESPYTQPKPSVPPVCEEVMDTLVTNMIMTRLPDATVNANALNGVLSAIPGRNLSLGLDMDTDYEPMKIDIPGNFGPSKAPKTQVSGLGKMLFTASESDGKTNYELSVMRIPDPNFAFGSFPGQIKAPSPGESGITNSGDANKNMTKEELNRAVTGSGYASAATFSNPQGNDKFKFDFYGMEAFLPQIDFHIAETITSTNETGANWKKMAEQEGGVETARQLFGLAQQLGLNGYLTFRLTESYVNQKFKDSNDKSRMAAVHFLMSNMGYDVRLTKFGDIFSVLLPFDQKVVYGLFPHTIDGRKYYMMYPEGIDKTKLPKAGTFSTCQLPNDALGKSSDLRLTGLSIPFKPKEFEISRNGISIKGVVNENLKQLLHKYPQMSAGDFASSWIDQSLREEIVDQVKAQVQDMSEKQAINTLMSLCHYGFNYATDQDYHGFEKPYFFEENFLYDYNDCEDRAIFFSYIVWNALGLPCQLIQYPGHESVTIAAKADINGCYYDNEGIKYYSSDPTYIGSGIGQVMPTFQSASPKIDKHYK
ncbi:MAG: hypothetical protein K2N35_14085 [Muribaculaceae bacterium]|nr:hypothetical protein [Muribaculaceae bacterium]